MYLHRLNILLLSLILLTFSTIASLADDIEIKDYITVGMGKDSEASIQDGLWKAVTAGMAKEIGDVSQDESILVSMKYEFVKNPSRFIRDFKLITQRESAGSVKSKVHAAVNVSAIREECKALIVKSVGGVSKFPSIAIMTDNEMVESALGEQFRKYGYNLVILPEGKALIKVKLKYFREGVIEFRDLHESTVGENARSDYLLLSSSSFVDKGIDPVSGLPAGALTLNLKVVYLLTDQIVVAKGGTVSLSTNGILFDEIVSKAARVMFNKVNSQIIYSWLRTQDIVVVYVKDIADPRIQLAILEALVEITGDRNFGKKIYGDSYLVAYRFINKNHWDNIRKETYLNDLRSKPIFSNVEINSQNRFIGISK